MQEEPFSNREIIKLFKEQNAELKLHMNDLIEPLTKQVTYTNGKLKRVIFVLTIVATATATLLFTNGSEVLELIKAII